MSTTPVTSRGRATVGGWLLVATALALVPVTSFGTESLFTETTYVLVSAGAAAAAWTAARWRPRGGGVRRLAAALTLNAVGDLLWQLEDWLTGSTPDVSVADVAYLAGYVALGAALIGHAGGGATTSRDRLHALLDSAAVLIAALLVVWQASIGTTLADDSLPLFEKVVLAA